MHLKYHYSQLIFINIIEGSDNSEAVNRFRNISEAWQVLSKPEVLLLFYQY